MKLHMTTTRVNPGSQKSVRKAKTQRISQKDGAMLLICDACNEEEEVKVVEETVQFKCGNTRAITTADIDALFKQHGGER